VGAAQGRLFGAVLQFLKVSHPGVGYRTDRAVRRGYSRPPLETITEPQGNAMTEAKAPKAVEVVAPCVRYTPAEVERNKKNRDDRRKALRSQNEQSRSMR
jgi:hypothetical protein